MHRLFVLVALLLATHCYGEELRWKLKAGQQFGEGDTRAGSKYYKEENITRINAFLDEIRPMAESKNATLAQLVIRWTLERPGITVALVGARNEDQAIQNARAIHVKLSAEEIKYINDRLYKVVLV